MSDHEQRVIQTVVTSAALGGFVFLAMVGWILVFDVSSIATMITGASEKDLISALFVSGALTKGVTIGAAIGLAVAARSRQAPCQIPAMSVAPAIS